MNKKFHFAKFSEKKFGNVNKSQRGISLYLAIIVLGIISGIVFGLTSLFLGQIKTLTTIGDSMKSFYSADSGVEHSLYNIRKENGDGLVLGNIDSDNSYQLFSCGVNCMISMGVFEEKTQRAIQINF